MFFWPDCDFEVKFTAVISHNWKWLVYRLLQVDCFFVYKVLYFFLFWDLDLISRESTHQRGLSLSVLVRELKEVDWFELGIQLNVPQCELRIIKRQYYYDVIRCLTEMLDLWLHANPNASWAEIAVALKHSSQGDLATTLASKYCTDEKGKRWLQHSIGTYLMSLWHRSV